MICISDERMACQSPSLLWPRLGQAASGQLQFVSWPSCVMINCRGLGHVELLLWPSGRDVCDRANNMGFAGYSICRSAANKMGPLGGRHQTPTEWALLHRVLRSISYFQYLDWAKPLQGLESAAPKVGGFVGAARKVQGLVAHMHLLLTAEVSIIFSPMRTSWHACRFVYSWEDAGRGMLLRCVSWCLSSVCILLHVFSCICWAFLYFVVRTRKKMPREACCHTTWADASCSLGQCVDIFVIPCESIAQCYCTVCFVIGDLENKVTGHYPRGDCLGGRDVPNNIGVGGVVLYQVFDKSKSSGSQGY